MKRLLISVAGLALVAAACGGSNDSGGSAAAVHNQADIDFVQGMIPHHEQAVTMSAFASTRASSARVKDLANRIEAAQEPEIKQMKGYLEDWDVELAGGDHGGAHGGGMAGHPGMLSEDELARLKAAKGAEFDRLFLQGMIGHHRGAITASEKEQAEGQSPEAKDLAGAIIGMQRAEITEMEQLLAAV